MKAPAWFLVVLTVIGVAAVLVGIYLYDPRAALIVAGIWLAAGALLGIDVEDSDVPRR